MKCFISHDQVAILPKLCLFNFTSVHLIFILNFNIAFILKVYIYLKMKISRLFS